MTSKTNTILPTLFPVTYCPAKIAKGALSTERWAIYRRGNGGAPVPFKAAKRLLKKETGNGHSHD